MANDVKVVVSADTSSVNSGLKAAQQSVEDFKKSTVSGFDEIKGAIAGTFAVGAIIEGVKGLFESFGNLADLAARTGESAESLQRVGNAAKKSGVDLDTIVKGMQKVDLNARAAVEGNEELAKAFSDVGIDAAAFVDLPLEDKVIALAEALDGAGSSADKTAFAVKAMAKSGGELEKFLNMGPDAIAEAFAQSAVASEATVNKIDNLGDKIGDVFDHIKVYGAEAISFVIGMVEDLAASVAAVVAFLGELPNGLKAANEAAKNIAQARSDMLAEENAKKDKKKSTFTPDTKAAEEAAKKAEDDEKELARLRESNDKKEHDAEFEKLTLLEKRKQLMGELVEIASRIPANDIDAEKNRGATLDAQKELGKVNEEIAAKEKKRQEELAKVKEKAAKEAAKDAEDAAKEDFKNQENIVKDAEHKANKGIPVDQLRRIGGNLSKGEFNSVNSQGAQLQKQVEIARQQLDILRKIYENAANANAAVSISSHSDFGGIDGS